VHELLAPFLTLPPVPPRRRYISGSIRLPALDSPLPVGIYRFFAPHSYTGQDLIELHCVSSPPLLDHLLAALIHAGARPAQPGEFTLRAFLAGKKDLTQAEAVLGVIHATNETDLEHALQQLAGGMSEPLHRLRDDLLNLLADVEAALDFTEEDIEFVSNRETILRLAAALAHVLNVKRQLESRAVAGEPPRVVLVGEPNAGKSALFNALLQQEHALVSPQAGTTRDYLEGTWQVGPHRVTLIDTAGWQAASTSIETAAQDLGHKQAAAATLRLYCVPCEERAPTQPLGHTDVLLVRTKADLHPMAPEAGLAVSAHTGTGLADLTAAVRTHLDAVHSKSLAPSLARCQGHIDEALTHLRQAHSHAVNADPPELLALTLRSALEALGRMTGTLHTNDLLDRIFSRFCIGK
jgi:tRNA modification GTPase